MKTPLWVIDFYTDEDGHNPVQAYVESLPAKAQAKILHVLTLLETFGIQLREPHTKALTGYRNLFELRIKQGSDIYRVFYFHWIDQHFVLLHGFTKKSNQTPRTEIAKALKRRDNYLNRLEAPHS